MPDFRYSDNQRFVSIIIPALNEEKYIDRCLGALKHLDYPTDLYEIIVVDNGSNDGTVQIAKSYGAHVLQKLDGTIASLRNHGVKFAIGEVIGFVDADCQVPRNWLKTAMRRFEHTSVSAVGCRLTHDPSTWVGRCWSLMHSGKILDGETDWLPSGNMIVRKKHFDEVEGFDEQLRATEDFDLCLRLRNKGYVVYSDPKVSSVHLDPPDSIGAFFKKELWHGREMIRMVMKSDISVFNYRALLYAGFYLFIITGMFAGLALYLTVQYKIPLIIFAIIGVTTPFVLACKTLRRRKKIPELLGLSLMYTLYGLARALCLLDARQYFK